ncbi:cell growth-regulating nucleolar protein [Salminus brasiliensis]|uniref:cell growth-regulating nucleolar protein n=1 Tax=Salminus brasiliensis TaxID=930266 RepID=UPI003B830F8C
MVFFTCNSCGESLKKAQIDKHLGMCRGCSCLSCIDCGKDFWGEDYKSHVRCISEDQKYGGKGYEAKANKGDVKQQQWIQRIQEAMNKPGVSSRLKEVLNQVSSYDNVPRKKAKFQNWIKNSLRINDASLQNQVWEIFSAADNSKPNGTQHPEPKPDPPLPQQPQEQQQEKEVEEKVSEKKKNKRERKEERQKKSKKKQKKHVENGETEQSGENASDEQKRKKKKRKRAAEEEEEEDGQDEDGKPTSKPKKRKEEEPEENPGESLEDQQDEQDQSGSKGKFNWKGTIKAVLQQAPDEGLPVKKLRKKVLAAYYSFSGDGNYRSEEEVFSLFNKKLKNPKFKVLKDKVRLEK